ncbi:hypothetical protein [Vulcanisaeta distributa]|uniref:hypothetical protein n=1 Tax=Vulcanisaeta distributa TaxID=164451 RepID=UPI0011E55373|nr:hypothetical protein [Vulcanisaeta distributa]
MNSDIINEVIKCGRHDPEHSSDYLSIANSNTFVNFIRGVGVKGVYCLDDLAVGSHVRGERYCDVYLDTMRGDVLVDFKLSISTGASAVEDLEDKLRGSISLISRVLKKDINPKYLIVVLHGQDYNNFRSKLIRKLRLRLHGIRFIREFQTLGLSGSVVVFTVKRDDKDDAVRIDNAVLGVVMV